MAALDEKFIVTVPVTSCGNGAANVTPTFACWPGMSGPPNVNDGVGVATTVVGSVPLLFVGMSSRGVATVTTFVTTPDGAEPDTATTKLIVADAPTASADVRVHVIVGSAEHVHPVPEPDTGSIPA